MQASRKKGPRIHNKNITRMAAMGSKLDALKIDKVHRNSMIDLSALNVSQEELNSLIEKHSQTSIKSIELRKESKAEVASEINAAATKSLGIWGAKTPSQATSRRDTSKRRKNQEKKLEE